MSAITGIYFGKAHSSPAACRLAVGRLFSLFSAEAANAKTPWGFAVCRWDGTHDVEAAPAPPRAGCGEDRQFRRLLAAATERTVAVLGYRGDAAEKGPRPAARRQPLKIGATIGADDASITNAEALSGDLGLTWRMDGRFGVTVRLVNMALAGIDGKDLAARLGTHLRLVDGAFAVAAWDRRFPEMLFIGRYRRGLYALYDERPEAVYFSSGPRLLRDLLGVDARPGAVTDNTLAVFRRPDLAPRQVKIFPENPPRGSAARARRRARGTKKPGYACRF